MNRVYLVWSGEYSDKGVEAVFSNEEDAERYAKIQGEINDYESYYVDEREVDEHVFKPDSKVVTYYEVEISLGELDKGEFLYDDYDHKEVFTKPVNIIIQNSNTWSHRRGIIVQSTTSFEHAKKIAIEQYQIYTQQQLEDGVL